MISAALVSRSRRVLGFVLKELAISQLPARASAATMLAAVRAVQRCMIGQENLLRRLVLGSVSGAFVDAVAIWTLARYSVIRDLRVMLTEIRSRGKPGLIGRQRRRVLLTPVAEPPK